MDNVEDNYDVVDIEGNILSFQRLSDFAQWFVETGSRNLADSVIELIQPSFFKVPEEDRHSDLINLRKASDERIDQLKNYRYVAPGKLKEEEAFSKIAPALKNISSMYLAAFDEFKEARKTNAENSIDRMKVLDLHRTAQETIFFICDAISFSDPELRLKNLTERSEFINNHLVDRVKNFDEKTKEFDDLEQRVANYGSLLEETQEQLANLKGAATISSLLKVDEKEFSQKRRMFIIGMMASGIPLLIYSFYLAIYFALMNSEEMSLINISQLAGTKLFLTIPLVSVFVICYSQFKRLNRIIELFTYREAVRTDINNVYRFIASEADSFAVDGLKEKALSFLVGVHTQLYENPIESSKDETSELNVNELLKIAEFLRKTSP